MRIENVTYNFRRRTNGSWLEALSEPLAAELGQSRYPLRFSIVAVQEEQVTVEATTLRYSAGSAYTEPLQWIEALHPRKKTFQAQPFGLVQVIPTGIRCEFGGFAGDGTPVTNLLASASDFIVTHPNAVNASELNEMADNVLYVEGKSLDDFLLGHLGLLPVKANKIGTLIDPTGADYIDYVVNTLNAARAVKGIDCGLYTVLEEELGVEIVWSKTGCAVGTVLRPEAILRGAELLLEHGVDAIGGVSVIHGVTKEMFAKHIQGETPNPSGGIEAIITHLISKILKVPTAHAPLPYYSSLKEKNTRNPRASAEFISTPHYFCVLKGLAKAPRLVALPELDRTPPHLLTVNHIGAIVMPASCLGGIPALAAEFSNIPLIAVRANDSILRVTNRQMEMKNVIEVDSYLEAAGVVLALRRGISLESLRRPLRPATKLESAQRLALTNGGVRVPLSTNGA